MARAAALPNETGDNVPMIEQLLTIGLIAMCAVALWSDVRTRRIPNTLTLTGLSIALLLRLAGEFDLLSAGLLGGAVAFGLSLPLFLVGGLGGGDVKLLAAVGAFLAPERLLVALLVMAVVGGVIALAAVIRKRALGRTFGNLWRMLKTAGLSLVFRASPAHALPTVNTPGAITTPYGVAIAAGALVGVFV